MSQYTNIPDDNPHFDDTPRHDAQPEAMTVRVMADGADGYRLVSADNVTLGWIRGRAIGVAGFDDDDAVVAASIRVYHALAGWLERQRLHPLPSIGAEPVRQIHDGAYRWILVGQVPIARFPALQPHDAFTSERAFEIVLKGTIGEGMAIHASLVALRAAHATIDAADIAWPARRRSGGAATPVLPTTHLDLESRLDAR